MTMVKFQRALQAYIHALHGYTESEQLNKPRTLMENMKTVRLE